MKELKIYNTVHQPFLQAPAFSIFMFLYKLKLLQNIFFYLPVKEAFKAYMYIADRKNRTRVIRGPLISPCHEAMLKR